MTRLPTRKTLAAMSAENRWSTLTAFARDLRNELDALTSGSVVSDGGRPLPAYRSSLRRRLRNVYAAADHFGHHVG